MCFHHCLTKKIKLTITSIIIALQSKHNNMDEMIEYLNLIEINFIAYDSNDEK